MSNFRTNLTKHRFSQRSPASQPSQGQASTVMTAVAFQDHMMKNLSLVDPFKPKIVSHPRPKPKKGVKSVVDTGLGKKTNKVTAASEPAEYVLDPKPPPPTLAQKLGLVEGGPQVLTEEDWSHVKKRSNDREDYKQPCVICKEDFGFQEQVLLSCTHVFHRACLRAFETFTGRKSCPMCRKEQYQTRVIHEGAKYHRVHCATKIQAFWRGHVVRVWYKKLRETNPPKDPKLRKKFYEEKLHSITERMVRSIDYNINDFLSEMDRSIQQSRDVFRHFDSMNQLICDGDWEKIQLKAVERGVTDCPICLTALDASNHQNETPRKVKSDTSKVKVRSGTAKVRPSGSQMATSRKSVLLSCSHVFHQTCLETFEELAVGERKNVCPVCRSNYQKKIFE